MTQDHIIENKASLVRLKTFLATLTDQDLLLQLCGDYTIASTLAHLAFWDQRALILVNQWKQTGVQPSMVDVDVINDACLPLCLAIPPRIAAELAVHTAEAIDRELERLEDPLVEDIQAHATQLHLSRAQHRNYHLDEIEALLQTKS